MKKEKYFDIFVIVFMLIQPVLDALTSIQYSKNVNFVSISLIVRGIFFILSLYKIYKLKEKRFLLLFIMYILLAISYYISSGYSNLLTNISNIIQIFYLPILIFLFSKYNNDKINDKFILIIYLIYLNLILIPYIFNIGFDITSRYINKKGYFGLFYFGNEISGILVGLLPIVLNYVLKANNYILKFIFYLELILVIYLVGTKTLFLGFILTCLYLYLTYYKDNYNYMTNKKKIIFLLAPIFFTITIIALIPKTPLYSNIKTTFDYYKINNVKEIFKFENIDNIIFSKRFDKVGIVNNAFVNGGYITLMYGLSKTKLLEFGTIELDFLDIFFSIGFFGSIIYLLMLIRSYKITGLRKLYDFCFFMFFIISLFSGHILLKPNVSIYIAILFLLSKNSIKIEKKKILLVSNMYPSEKYKYYGSFVKNTKEILEENNFDIDLCVIKKQDNFILKLFSYIIFHLKTIIKGIINNYDYIYVHFISHSSFGAVFTKIFTKNTKLVFNAHGNDVVADYDYEKKNIEKSKNYIKYADKIVVPSKYFKDIMVKDYKVKEENIFIYPSGGVNTKLFKKIDKNKAKKSCNLKKEYEYIGYISRIEKNKGFDTFIKAINELKKENKIGNKRFLIVGTGNLEADMNQLIKEYDLFDYIEIRSMTSQNELVNIYNSLEIFVFPTYRKSESLGLVGLEAMACETFIICANNYGPTDYIKNKKNGLTFKPKNEVDLKNKILDYYNLNNEELNKIRKKERETALNYDSYAIKKEIIKVFN